MLKYEQGNLVTGNYPVFCHQVNCKKVMGTGIAKQIRNKYPEVYNEYMQIENPMLGFILPVFTTDGRICINMFAQNEYGRDKRYTDYIAFAECLNVIAGFMKDRHINTPIAFPYKIGCGLAGGDWYIVLYMLKDFSEKIEQDTIIVSLN